MSPTLLAKLREFERVMATWSKNGSGTWVLRHDPWWSHDLVTLFKADRSIERFWQRQIDERNAFYDDLDFESRLWCS